MLDIPSSRRLLAVLQVSGFTRASSPVRATLDPKGLYTAAAATKATLRQATLAVSSSPFEAAAVEGSSGLLPLQTLH